MKTCDHGGCTTPPTFELAHVHVDVDGASDSFECRVIDRYHACAFHLGAVIDGLPGRTVVGETFPPSVVVERFAR
jgi:hypothetical protein